MRTIVLTQDSYLCLLIVQENIDVESFYQLRQVLRFNNSVSAHVAHADDIYNEKRILHFLGLGALLCESVFTCVSYAEARNRYRLDVRPSVCLSVCPSVTRWHPINTAEYIVMISSPHDSPFILVLCVTRYSRNSDGVTPCAKPI